MSLFNLNVLLPRTPNKETDLSVMLKVAEKYKGFFNVPVSFVISKNELWIAKCKRTAVESKGKYISFSLLKAMEECDKDIYSSHI